MKAVKRGRHVGYVSPKDLRRKDRRDEVSTIMLSIFDIKSMKRYHVSQGVALKEKEGRIHGYRSRVWVGRGYI